MYLFTVLFHKAARQDFEGSEDGLRGAGKALLDRLARKGQGAGGLRIEKVRSGIFELKLSWNQREFRFLFFYGASRKIYIAHFLEKKSRKLSPHDIDLALVRKREIELECTSFVGNRPH